MYPPLSATLTRRARPLVLLCNSPVSTVFFVPLSFVTLYSAHGPSQHCDSTFLHLWEPPSMFLRADDAAAMGPFHRPCIHTACRCSPAVHAISNSINHPAACASHDATEHSLHVQYNTISYLAIWSRLNCSNTCDTRSSGSGSWPNTCNSSRASSPNKSGSWPQT